MQVGDLPGAVDFCRQFDHAAARTFGPVDIVTMNGVLHHLSGEEAAATLSAIYDVLRPGGTLFTLDGAYIPGQPWFSCFMLDHDRGRYVRTPGQYIELLGGAFESIEFHVHEDLSWAPYTFFIAVSRKADLQPTESSQLAVSLQ